MDNKYRNSTRFTEILPMNLIFDSALKSEILEWKYKDLSYSDIDSFIIFMNKCIKFMEQNENLSFFIDNDDNDKDNLIKKRNITVLKIKNIIGKTQKIYDVEKVLKSILTLDKNNKYIINKDNLMIAKFDNFFYKICSRQDIINVIDGIKNYLETNDSELLGYKNEFNYSTLYSDDMLRYVIFRSTNIAGQLHEHDIDRIINVGNSLHKFAWVIDQKYHDDFIVESIPYSGKGPTEEIITKYFNYIINEETINDDKINYFINYLKNHQIDIVSCAKETLRQRVGFIDYVKSGEGIKSFYLLTIIMIYINCNNNKKKFDKFIKKYIENTYLCLIEIAYEDYDIIKDINDYIQLLNIGDLTCNVLIASKAWNTSNTNVDYDKLLEDQFLQDVARCHESFKYSSWSQEEHEKTIKKFHNNEYYLLCLYTKFRLAKMIHDNETEKEINKMNPWEYVKSYEKNNNEYDNNGYDSDE